MDGTETTSEVAGRGGWRTIGSSFCRQFWSLNGQALCAMARRRTGLEYFGDPPIEPALSVLAESLEREADLHTLGRFLMRAHLRGLLETRLRLADAWSRQREALEATPIHRPVFITGIPRSGSTFLHELMAADPDNRVPRVWEVMFPVPVTEARQGGRDPRVRKAAASLWWFRRLAPRADAVHPLRAWTPHECLAIHSYTLLSEEFVSTCRVPTYEAFLHAMDLRPAYAWQKRFLQHLQLGRPAKRWVLKAPDHVHGLEELFSIFPDARIIQTHRNPLEALPSLTQLTEVLCGLFGRVADRKQIGRREARAIATSMELFIQFRELRSELAGRFIDVDYSELVRAPLAVVRRIYQQLEIPLTAAAAEGMRCLAASRSRYRRHHASPTLADLGLDAAAEARRFERYCRRFGVQCRPVESR